MTAPTRLPIRAMYPTAELARAGNISARRLRRALLRRGCKPEKTTREWYWFRDDLEANASEILAAITSASERIAMGCPRGKYAA